MLKIVEWLNALIYTINQCTHLIKWKKMTIKRNEARFETVAMTTQTHSIPLREKKKERKIHERHFV